MEQRLYVLTETLLLANCPLLYRGHAAPDHRSRLVRLPLPCGGAVQHDRREPAA